MSKKFTDALTWLTAGILCLVVAWQAVDYFHFRKAGARFTAADGQVLCQRVQYLERRMGLTGADCRFLEPPP